MDIIDKIKLHYPLPIAKMYAAVNLETDPRLQVRKQVDLFEGIVQYLTLIGLATYTHHQLADSNVEQLRPGLARPSLGHWVTLLKALTPLMKPYNVNLLGDAADKKHNSDAIGDGARAMAQTTTGSQRKRVTLYYFLTTAIEFRNKKFGHGSISKPQARQVVKPLEEALLLWLETLSILHRQKLIYVVSAEWDGSYFAYRGYNLNAGGLPGSFSGAGDERINGKQVYLYEEEKKSFLPLHPLFLYDDDYHQFYVYNCLSNREELSLHCPYEAEVSRLLNVDKTIVIGSETGREEKSEEVEVKTPEVPTAVPSASTSTPAPEESSPQTASVVAASTPPKPVTFDELVQDLEMRIRQVSQARYPVLWLVGEVDSGKTSLAKAVCQRTDWQYVNFTLDEGYLDALKGQEQTYLPEDFVAFLHLECQSSTAKVIILDEIEALLGWWSWDEQQVFFKKTGKATGLNCGVVLTTRLRSVQQLKDLTPGKSHIFEIPKGVEL